MRALAMVALALLVQGCAVLDWIKGDAEAAKTLLVLRASYETPARQAGVLDVANRQAARLDEALSQGDVRLVKLTLRSMEPIYRDIYANVESPTAEQVKFHNRVMALWEYVEQEDGDRWGELALILLGEVFERVVL